MVITVSWKSFNYCWHFFNSSCKWDLETGRKLSDVQAHNGDVVSISLSSDGNSFVTGSVDRSCRLWDIREEKPKQTFFGHEADVNSVCVSKFYNKKWVGLSYTVKLGLSASTSIAQRSGRLCKPSIQNYFGREWKKIVAYFWDPQDNRISYPVNTFSMSKQMVVGRCLVWWIQWVW